MVINKIKSSLPQTIIVLILKPTESMKRNSHQLFRTSLLFFVLMNVSLLTFAQNTLDNLGYSNSDPKAEVAYSLRQLSTSYTGPLVRVSINGNTYDVWADVSGSFSMSSVISSANPGTIPGAKNGATTLSTVATGNTATIAIWYNQSGSSNNYNALQPTVSQQPRIINAGIIDVQNGKPSACFNAASSQFLQSATYAFYNFGSGASILSVWSRTGTGQASLFSFYETASSNFLNLWTPNPNSMRFESGVNGGNIQTTYEAINTNNLYQQSCVGNVQSINGANGLTGGNTGIMTSAFTSQFTLGAYAANGFWSGYLSELVVFNANLTNSTKLTGESNQMVYYSTTVSLTPPGNALEFDGINDNVTINSTTAGNFGTSAFTVETWIRTALGPNANDIVNKWNICAASSFWNCRMYNGKLQLEVGEAYPGVNYTQLTGNTIISDNKWHHIAYTRSATGVLSLYVDGKLDTTTTPSAIANISNNDPIRIGNSVCGFSSINNLFQGSLDEMRIWNVERSQAQLQASMLNTISPSSTGLMAYYNFDNGLNVQNNPGITTLSDATSNNITGSLNNFSLIGPYNYWVESYAMVVPTATAATSITSSGFTANWTAPTIGTVDNYLLDVSTTADFSGPISGSPFTLATGTTSKAVNSGIGTFYYRVRAEKSSVSGQGGYSNIISQSINQVPPGNALNFDGVNDFVSTSNLINNPQNFTISAWFKTTATSGGYLVGFSEYQTANTNLGSADRVISMNASGTLSFYIYNASGHTITSSSTYNDGKYHHVAASISNGNGMRLYVDGVLVASNAGVTTAQNYSGYWRINYVAGVYLNATIDQVKIYNAALNLTAVQIDMFDTSTIAANLQYYYNFDNGTANGNNAGLTNLTSVTLNANSGTLNNFTLNSNTSNWVESYAMVIPTTTAAINATAISFTANWTAPTIGIVDNYLLDVSTSSTFSSFVSGYNGLMVSGTSQTVSGLISGTTYYYRVRADKSSVTSQGGYSNVTSATTSACVNTSSTTNTSICSSALPYTWNSLTFNTAGSQTAYFTNYGGCDSAATLNLTVNSATTSTTNTSVCAADLPYSWNGLTFNAAGSQTAHFANYGGCDSAATLNLTVNSPSTSTTNSSICAADLPYSWNSLTFNAAGSQTAHFTNAVGCDSAATLNLTVNSASTSITNTSICSIALPYSWNSLTFNAAGSQTAHFTNASGCDSAATLNLTVNNVLNNTTTITACDSYTWSVNSQTYTSSGTYQVVNGCSTETLDLTINITPTVTAPANSAVCVGSSVTLSGSGAATYSWNNGVSNGIAFNPTSTTTYTVTGTTNGCSNTAQTTVSVNQLPTVNAGVDKTICPGTSISLSATGAVSYSWSGGVVNGTSFTPSATTTYVVTGTNANNCSNKDTVVVNIRDLSIGSITPVICKGVADTLTAPSGSNYQWKKNGSNMSGKTTRSIYVAVVGSYSVTYQDSMCGLKTLPAIVLTLKTPPAKPLLYASKAAICPGDSTTLFTNVVATKYIWFLGSTTSVLAGASSINYHTTTIGTYYVKALDSFGCRSAVSGAKVIKANVIPVPVVTVVNATQGAKKLACTNAGTYQWRLNGNNIAGATAKAFIATQSGAYSVMLTSNSGCTAISSDTTLTINYTGPKMSQEELAVISTAEDINVYPNPSNGIIYIDAKETLKAVIIDLQGRTILESNHVSQLDITGYSNGIYLLQLFNEDGEMVKAIKLIKE